MSLGSKELLLFPIDDILSSVEVALLRCHHLALSHELVTKDEHEVDWDTNVSGDESLVIKVAVGFWVLDERTVVLGESDEDAHEQSAVRAVDAKRGNVRHVLVLKTLGASGTDEEDVGDKNRDPGHKTENGDDVHKVQEDGTGVVADVHEGNESDDDGNTGRVVWHTELVDPGEDARRVLVAGQAV